MKRFVIFFLIITPLVCNAQNSIDRKKFENLFSEKNPGHNWSDQLKNNRNELTFIFSATFVIYKEVFSSQDIDACMFTPSCSVYAIESIKRKGVIVGFFNAVDRLTRCNPGRKKNLPVDKTTGKYYDPVE